MIQLPFKDSIYRTDSEKISPFVRTFPGLTFYSRFINIVYKSSVKAKQNRYDDEEWCQSSLNVLRALENVGICVEIAGIDNIKQLDTPCVVIGNHMSVLETVILPAIIVPYRRMTYIVKQSLLEYPVFKHIMRSRDPIAVNRKNPRHDLKAVLEGGMDRLKRGISVIVFPQTTRSHSFDSTKFNTIGIKLAQKAGVPVIPLALLTDAWGTGKYVKDFGGIDSSKNVHFSFGEPMLIQSRGSDEHHAVIQFINRNLRKWKDER
ncbi:MAG: 1-acyl-sn-glycerol-3-phosphate acyltransferase [Candidatus Latescibacteria bacterium]|jgi:1-acyl-sn-glycerol-3-phosphate acyltransferase|nr:1-acyl-sn-glycerol-3-phosphate acyltransferase [Candidatus Latescibacterota bacterium]